ncbi:hypothetical protein EC973_006143 [Apophysomyces ossiformis]|uniref:Uncharacterized protein n=1 Tax=Apophysomyces ossiformis TaxID=679940 RepID=A0A8H7BJT8_9FUNG|nr:hypothetical protein EC973_006143 [Apophysomyces ossiformis]
MKSNINSNSGNSFQGHRKAGFFRSLSLISAITFLLLPVQEVAANGALGFPLARQYGCRIDGGYYWPDDGSKIPNEGCRNAYLDAGKDYYAFQEWHKVSAYPTDPSNFSTVMKAVPDGLLCAGGDKRKRGLDIPQNQGWRKTEIEPKNGKFQLRWDNTAAQNPSNVKIYITKPTYDLTKSLTWNDLDKIYDAPAPDPVAANGKGFVPQVSSFYYFDVPVGNRTGDAIIYGYVQRLDADNEGFFNCADVSIKQAGADNTDNKPAKNSASHAADTEWVKEQPYLQRGVTPSVGDKIRFRITAGEKDGQKAADVTLPITSKNVHGFKWSKDLANRLNREYKSQVKVGVQAGKSIKFDYHNLQANQVWLKSGYSSSMAIIKAKHSAKH